MKYGLKDSILENIAAVFSKHPKIEKVLLYGSRAKGNYKNGSDIDLTLIGENLDLQDLNKVSLDLDEIYLPYSFDLSIFENIENEELIEHISRIGVTIYERPVKC